MVNHATDEEFSTFDKDKLGAETDGNATNVGLAATSHIGFWFNNTDNILSDFHSNKMNTYLNIRNPKEYSSLEDLVADMDNGNGNGNSKEVLDDIQGVLDKMHIVINRIKLESNTHFAVISKEYKGIPRDKRLLTAYEKKNSVLDNTMNTAETLRGNGNDTATPENAVSQDKNNATETKNQEKVQKNFSKPTIERLSQPPVVMNLFQKP